MATWKDFVHDIYETSSSKKSDWEVVNYLSHDCDVTKVMASLRKPKPNPPSPPRLFHYTAIKDVKFNNPATIIFWEDGTKTVVKAQNKEKFDPEKGIAMAIVKKIRGDNKGRYFNEIKKWAAKYNETKK